MGGSRGTSPMTPRPKAHGSARRDRGDGRLDPVRWHRPARGTLLRLAAVAVLLATAAAASWSPVRTTGTTGATCADETGADETGAATPPPAVAAPPSAATTPSAVPSGSVGVPVRLTDPTALSLVRPGNRVDLLRPDDASTVATAALVLKVTGAGDPTAGGLLLALSPADAVRAVAAPGHGFAILIRPG